VTPTAQGVLGQHAEQSFDEVQPRRVDRREVQMEARVTQQPASMPKANASWKTGEGKAGFGKGNFYAEPTPRVKLHAPSRHWHAAKILFEKDSLRRWL